MSRRTRRTVGPGSLALTSVSLAAATLLAASAGAAGPADAPPAQESGAASPTGAGPQVVEVAPQDGAAADQATAAPALAEEPADGAPSLDPGSSPAVPPAEDPTPDAGAGPSGEPPVAPGVLAEVDGAPAAGTGPTALTAAPEAGEQPAAAEEDGEVFAADFGDGKETVSFGVAALEGTPFPADADLSGAELEVEYTGAAAAFVDGTFSPDSNGSFTCETGTDGFCDAEVLFFEGGTVSVTQLSAPAGFLVPDDAVRTGEDAECTPAAEEGPFESEECTLVIEDPGAFRTLGVELTSSVDGRPLADGDFELCEPADEQGCAALTTGADGTGLFDGLYLPGDYEVEQTAAPAGYLAATGLSIDVPAATSVAQALQPVLLPVQNDADVPPPTARDDAASTGRGAPVEIPVLGNDDGAGAPLTVTAVGSSPDGTTQLVERSDCAGAPDCPDAVRFTPAEGFTGTTSFVYTASTRGGSDTATVTVTVVAPAAAPRAAVLPRVEGRQLPRTGSDAALLAAAGALIGGGALLRRGGQPASRQDEQH